MVARAVAAGFEDDAAPPVATDLLGKPAEAPRTSDDGFDAGLADVDSGVVRPVAASRSSKAHVRQGGEGRALADEDSDFGRYLRRSREARCISLEEVARRTRIREHWLEHLEASRLDELPAEVFVRGFVRAHARTVGADEQQASRMLSRRMACRGGVTSVPCARVAPEEAHSVERAPNDGRRTGVALAVIMLLIAATLAVSMLMRRPTPVSGPVSHNLTPTAQRTA